MMRDLGELLREVKDPRVQGATLITVTHVKVSDDLSTARVMVSVIADDRGGVMKGLSKAAGFLQGRIGKRMAAKKVPELRFVLDDTEERAGRVDQILREIQAEKEPHE
jgi:ribosome-binding factor A